jgi:hypothetical protein
MQVARIVIRLLEKTNPQDIQTSNERLSSFTSLGIIEKKAIWAEFLVTIAENYIVPLFVLPKSL